MPPVVDEIIDIINRIPKDGKTYCLYMNYAQFAQLSTITDFNGNFGCLIRYANGYPTMLGMMVVIDNKDFPIRAISEDGLWVKNKG